MINAKLHKQKINLDIMLGGKVRAKIFQKNAKQERKRAKLHKHKQKVGNSLTNMKRALSYLPLLQP